MGRLSRQRDAKEAEFAVLVTDQYQKHGLGTALLGRMLEVARAEGLCRLTAGILMDNRPMQRICEKLDFRLTPDPAEGIVKAEIDL